MRLTQIRRFPERFLSTVHRGTAFEYRALALLTKHMSMSLTRVGGSYDGGVDLIGWWWVPGESPGATCPLDASADPPRGVTNTANNRRRLRVLAQCKAEKKKIGPAYLRELEGVLFRHTAYVSGSASASDPPSDPPRPAAATSAAAAADPPPVALLVSESPFTRSCLLTAHASPLPFLLVHLPPPSDDAAAGPSALGAIFGNPALVSARGVLGGQLEIRWEHGSSSAPSGALGGAGGRPGLWWQGRPLPSWTPDVDHPDAVLK
ncbi:hypothetical protein BC826DRAFT_1091974 [Russula brevipes]|nr:hypothetical protein BC826DRAFT_1091974 [Russula brevipes]